MRVLKLCLMMLSLGAFILSAPFNAKADEWNKATTLTFSRPVEVPGMVLGPGTYLFKLADTVDRNVVQIYNADESHLYENVLAIPAYRQQATDNTVVTFEERAKGVPEAIGTWFYPGDNYGEEFVYPKIAATAVAAAAPAAPATTSSQTTAKPAPVAQQSNPPAITHVQPTTPPIKSAPVQVAQAAPQPATSSAAATAPVKTPKTLPKTASPIPFLILLGLLSLGGSVSIHVFSKRSV